MIVLTISQIKDAIQKKTAEYFEGYNVIFSNQSRIVKPNIPLVVITTGAIHRPYIPMIDWVNDRDIYICRIPITIDLFTNGREVRDDDTGQVIAYENSAVDEMLGYIDFLNLQRNYEWSLRKNISIQVLQDAQDVTNAVNDSNYAYRSRCELTVYFTHVVKDVIPPIDHVDIHFSSIEGKPNKKQPYPRYPNDVLGTCGIITDDKKGEHK